MFLMEKLLEKAVEKALEKLRSGQDQRLSRQPAIKRELSLVEAREKNLVDAISRGENMEPLWRDSDPRNAGRKN